jgi:CRP-like cAMP-binding protein
VDCAIQNSCVLREFPKLGSLTELRFYGRGFSLHHQGSEARRALIVRTGWIQITHVTREGKSIVSLAGPGALLGFYEVLSGGPYLTSACTLEESQIESLSADDLLSFLEAHPSASISLLKSLSAEQQKWLGKLYDLSSRVSVDQRLLRALCEMAGTCGCEDDGGVRIKVPVSKQMLADIIGCSRQWISTVLAGLEARGLIRQKSCWITLRAAAFAEVKSSKTQQR